MIRKLGFYLCLFFLVSFAEAQTIKTIKVNPNLVVRMPTRVGCLTPSLTLVDPKNIWYTEARFSVTNNCTTAQDLNKSVVTFKSNSNNLSAMWSPSVNDSSQFTYQNGVASAVLNIKTGPLGIGKTLTLSFGVNLSGVLFTYSDLNIVSAVPTPVNGEIDIQVNPAGMAGVTSAAKIVVSGPGLTSPYSISNSNWSSPTLYKITGLAYGTYTVSPQPIDSTYVGTATPATVTINSGTPVISTISYKPAPAVGALQISLGAAPMTGLASSITATLKDNTTNQSQSVALAWNGMKLIQNLVAGDNYTLTLPQVSNGVSFSNAVPLSGPILIAQGRTTPLTVSYQTPQPMPSQAVQFNISGLPTGVQAALTIVDGFGNTFNQTITANGQVSQALPVNDTFSVSVTAPGVTGTVSPASFTLQSGSPAPAVNITFSATPPPPISSANFLAYADSGMQSSGNGLVPPKGANLMEAFILYTGGKADLWAITRGDPISNIIKNTPKTMASVGGANGPYPWDFESIAQGVTDISSLIDYYGFIGIDFDVEGAALQQPNAQNWVANVAYQLRQKYPNLILVFTIPDPVASGDATYPGLPYGSPAILLKTLALNNGKMVFNWVNKMDFDQNGLNVGCTQTNTDMNTNCLVISGTAGAQSLAKMLNVPVAEAYKYLGETFMVPVDDQGHALPLSLANQVATALKAQGVTHMGYWSLQRDTANRDYGNLFTKILGLS